MKSPTKTRAGIIGTALSFLLLIQLLARYPRFVETYYSNGLYRIINIFVSNFSSQFPFSFTEFCVWFILIIGVPLYIGRIRKKKPTLGRLVLNVLTGISILIIWFYLFWGINYFRVPIKAKLGLDRVHLQKTALDSTFTDIIHHVNKLNLSYPVHSMAAINNLVDASYRAALKDSLLSGFQPEKTIKTFAVNGILNKTTTSGFFSPFFHEVHYNSDLLTFELPFVIAHEKAHAIGYTSESEANFIAFLICKTSSDALVRYSAYFYLLGYFFSNVRSDSTKYRSYVNALSAGVKLDLSAVRERWKAHRGFISKLSNKSYDMYLKANKVEEGIHNYSMVVDLVVRYYAKNNLLKN